MIREEEEKRKAKKGDGCVEVECGAVRLERDVEDEMQLCKMSWVAHMHMLHSGLGLHATCMREE